MSRLSFTVGIGNFYERSVDDNRPGGGCFYLTFNSFNWIRFLSELRSITVSIINTE